MRTLILSMFITGAIITAIGFTSYVFNKVLNYGSNMHDASTQYANADNRFMCFLSAEMRVNEYLDHDNRDSVIVVSRLDMMLGDQYFDSIVYKGVLPVTALATIEANGSIPYKFWYAFTQVNQ